jgi:hypothetical protein
MKHSRTKKMRYNRRQRPGARTEPELPPALAPRLDPVTASVSRALSLRRRLIDMGVYPAALRVGVPEELARWPAPMRNFVALTILRKRGISYG